MSTQQPPGGPSEGGYAQPQDPWAGTFEPGVASVPTDPIPQPYDQYGGRGPGEMWQQPGEYGYVPQQRTRSTGKAIGIGALVLALAGGAGYGAYYFTTNRGTTSANSTTPPATTTSSTTPTRVPFNIDTAAVNQCVFNDGTLNDPNLRLVDCSMSGSYRILKVTRGTGIPENAQGKMDDSTSLAVCGSNPPRAWYAWDQENDELDVFLCLQKNP
jgi:hypothetical protein